VVNRLSYLVSVVRSARASHWIATPSWPHPHRRRHLAPDGEVGNPVRGDAGNPALTMAPDFTRAGVGGVRRPMTAATALFTAAVALLCATLAGSDPPERAVVWGSLALASYSGGVLCFVGRRQGADLGLGLWRLGPWTLLWYGVIFGLGTISLSHPWNSEMAEIAPSSILKVLWLIAAAITAMAAGYVIGPGGHARRLSTRATGLLSRRFAFEVRSPALPWILCAIGVIASMALTASTGVFGYVGGTMASVSKSTGYDQVFGLLSESGELAVVTAALQVFRERLPGARATLTVIFVVELALDLASGGMESSIITVLAVAIPYGAARRRLPKAALALSLLIFLIVVIPFTNAYRKSVHGPVTLSAAQSVIDAPEIFARTTTVRSMATALPSSVHLVALRLSLISSPAIILQRTPGQIGFTGTPAEILEAPFLGIIPRALWPDKPRDLSGYRFDPEYFGSPSRYSWAAITLVGSLYQYGGWLPVLGGMFLIGCLMRLIDQAADIRANPHTILLVLLLFPGIVEGQTSWLTTISSIPENLAFFLLAVCMAFRPRSRMRWRCVAD
jgi:hypothetical protein